MDDICMIYVMLLGCSCDDYMGGILMGNGQDMGEIWMRYGWDMDGIMMVSGQDMDEIWMMYGWDMHGSL